SKHAANQQAKATNAALDFEKQREAERKAEYDQQQAQARRQWEVYQGQMQPFRNIASQYLARYGYKPALWTLGDYANPNGSAPGGMIRQGMGGGRGPMPPPQAPPPQAQTLGAMAQRDP